MNKFQMPMTRERILDFMPKGGVVAEIGVFRGDFAVEMYARTAPLKLHLIDPWQVITHAGGRFVDGEANLAECRRRFVGKENVLFHRNGSPGAAAMYPAGHFDYVHIDACHNQKQVGIDLNAWLPKVKVGGYILGHDYHPPEYVLAEFPQRVKMSEWPDFGVDLALDEFLNKNRDRVRMVFLCDVTFVVEVYR